MNFLRLLKKKSMFFITYKKALTLSVLCCLIWVTSSNAQSVHKNQFSLQVEAAKLVDIFKDLEASTGYTFRYSDDVSKDQSEFNYDLVNKPLNDLLTLVSEDAHLEYKIDDKSVSIRKVSDIKVSGRVVDQESGEPLLGVAILVKKSPKGTVTDIDGTFEIYCPSNAVLQVSYLGYESHSVSVANNSNIEIALSQGSQMLNEFVVVGYGTQKKRDLTGSVNSSDSESIEKSGAVDPAGAIQGKFAGVDIVRNNSRPGNSYSINIRGVNSIDYSNEPLFVIDGILSNSGMADINPADIERIDILKDASATAIYGARGANGVVIVTTKRGKDGVSRINYQGSIGIVKATNLPNMYTGRNYVDFYTELFENQGKDTSRDNKKFFTSGEWENIDNGIYYNWPKLISRNGIQTSHTVSMTGGNENSKYSISLGYLNNEGVEAPQQQKRYTMRLNLDHNVNSWAQIGGSGYYTHTINKLGANDAIRSAYNLQPTESAFDSEGNRLFWPSSSAKYPNPLFDLENDINENYVNRFLGNFFLKIKPTKELELKSSLSAEYKNTNTGQYRGTYTNANNGTSKPTAKYDNNTKFDWVWDNTINFKKTINNHSINALGLFYMQKHQSEYIDTFVEGLPYDSKWYQMQSAEIIRRLNTGYDQWSLMSTMGRVNYDYNSKFLVTVTGRYDGSSKLAEGNNWKFFPSAAVAWKIHHEKFTQDFEPLSEMKLRVSYGQTGNDNIPSFLVLGNLDKVDYNFGNNAAIGYAPVVLGNNDLTWEKTSEINMGLDFGFFRDRLTGSIDVYRRVTDDLLQARDLPEHTGYAYTIANVGKVENKGVELTLSTVNIDKGNFRWRSDIAFAKNNNSVLKLADGVDENLADGLIVGQPIGVVYNYKFDGIWQEDEADQADLFGAEPGQVKVRDLNGDGKITSEDRTSLGSVQPKWTGSITNNFKLNGFDLSVNIYTRQGIKVMDDFMSKYGTFDGDKKDQGGNHLDLPYYTSEKPSNAYPAPGNPGKYKETLFIQDASFVRIGNISMGYTFPKSQLKKLMLDNLRVYTNVLNPFMFTKYHGFDPEWAKEEVKKTGVSVTTFQLGVNATF